MMQDNAVEAQLESVKIIPSSGGKFEVVVNGDLVYSKLATGRHAQPGEARRLIKAKL
ncbi:MAG: Rdx family protein [Anaerolineae bacterium]|nr:Rdx family protein [Anaerolineae bacterium]